MTASEKLLIEKLRDGGIEVQSIWDLVREPTPDEAIPLLRDFLPEVPEDDHELVDGIVRAISVSRASKYSVGNVICRILEKLVCRDERSRTRAWALSNCLSIVATDDEFDCITKLITKRNDLGIARQMLWVSLGRMNMRAAESTGLLLESLDVDHPDVGHILKALQMLKAKVPLRSLENVSRHPEVWIRREAERLREQAS